jgi:hypothetical protein
MLALIARKSGTHCPASLHANQTRCRQPVDRVCLRHANSTAAVNKPINARNGRVIIISKPREASHPTSVIKTCLLHTTGYRSFRLVHTPQMQKCRSAMHIHWRQVRRMSLKVAAVLHWTTTGSTRNTGVAIPHPQASRVASTGDARAAHVDVGY